MKIDSLIEKQIISKLLDLDILDCNRKNIRIDNIVIENNIVCCNVEVVDSEGKELNIIKFPFRIKVAELGNSVK